MRFNESNCKHSAIKKQVDRWLKIKTANNHEKKKGLHIAMKTSGLLFVIFREFSWYRKISGSVEFRFTNRKLIFQNFFKKVFRQLFNIKNNHFKKFIKKVQDNRIAFLKKFIF